MNLEDYKVKCLTALSEEELICLYNDCNTFNFFQKRDINIERDLVYNKLFASGIHVTITDIIDIRSFISSRKVEFVIDVPNKMHKQFFYKYNRSIKYQITKLLCKAINYKRYQSEEKDKWRYNRLEIHRNYANKLYEMLSSNNDSKLVLDNIRKAILYFFTRRATFSLHNYYKVIKISDEIQLEVSSVCKGIITIKVNDKHNRLVLFIEKSIIGIHNYLVILERVNKLLSSSSS